MGLDMYVYRVHKPLLDENVVYDANEIKDPSIPEDDIDNPVVRQILPYCKKVRVINHYYDLEKISKDYGIEGARIGGWGSDETGGYTVFDGKNIKSVKINEKLIESKYTINKEETCYVFVEEQIHYWRKAYDVQEWFHKNIPEPVENTGYYILTEDLLLAFNKAFPDEQLPVEAPDEGHAFVYWEWY